MKHKHISEQIADILYKEIDYIEDQLVQYKSLRYRINNLEKELLDIIINYLYNHEDLFKDRKDIDVEELGYFIINNISDLVESVYYDGINFNLNIKDLIITGIEKCC